MSLPLISVLMPAYNEEKYIGHALDSIISTQYSNLEIIVVNDGSSDKTAEIVEHYPFPIRLYHQENKGISITRNRALELMKGDIFTFLDADDWWLPYKLSIQLPLLDDADIVLGQTRKVIDQMPWVSLLLSSGLYRRSSINTIGNFAEDLVACEDIDWMYRAWEANLRIVHHHNVVHVYRRHESNTTADIDIVHKKNMRLLKLSLERRRKSGSMKRGQFMSNFVETLPDEEFIKNGI
jgi:glycosyltransferase involved in cell wall biosynthesis